VRKSASSHQIIFKSQKNERKEEHGSPEANWKWISRSERLLSPTKTDEWKFTPNDWQRETKGKEGEIKKVNVKRNNKNNVERKEEI